MSHFLDKIRQSTQQRVQQMGTLEIARGFHLDFSEIFSAKKPSIIAEIKFASPSKGRIYPGNLDHVQIAAQYLENGADALSILTEPTYFKGKIQYIADIKTRFPKVQILLKDFVLSEIQIKQAYGYGVTAVLLIVAFLEKNHLQQLYHYILSLGLMPIVEVCDLPELLAIQSLEPKCILINNRNLKTQQISLNISKELLPYIQKSTHVISGSGIVNAQELKSMMHLGFNGILIGTALMSQPNPGLALKRLLAEAENES